MRKKQNLLNPKINDPNPIRVGSKQKRYLEITVFPILKLLPTLLRKKIF